MMAKAATYRAYIAVKDEAESHRKKEGDVLLVRPHVGNYGFIPLKNTLIVLVKSDEDLTELNAREENKPKFNFRFPFEIVSDWMPGVDFDKVADPKCFYQPFLAWQKAIHGHNGYNGTLRPYTTKELQRLIRMGQLVNERVGKKKRLLRREDIDCGGQPDTEIILDASEPFAMIQDKRTGKFKHPQRRNG